MPLGPPTTRPVRWPTSKRDSVSARQPVDSGFAQVLAGTPVLDAARRHAARGRRQASRSGSRRSAGPHQRLSGQQARQCSSREASTCSPLAET